MKGIFKLSQLTFQPGLNNFSFTSPFVAKPVGKQLPPAKYKLAVIYNTCGLQVNRENVDYYIEAIESILNQDFDSFQVFVSSCLNTRVAMKRMQEHFEGRVNFNFITELHPVNVTFNHTALKAYEWFGEFDGYLYIDSGITFGEDRNVLKGLYDLYKSGPYGMVGTRTDTDSGVWAWFGLGAHQWDETGQNKIFEQGHFVIPVGKALNLHCQIFSREVFHAMNKRLMPDIFASHCTESVFTFVTAAVGQKFIYHKDIVVHHAAGMDGGSSGFAPIGKVPYKHLYKSPKTMDEILQDPEAWESGFGYEELQSVFMHNKKCYDENGNHKNPQRLEKFIKENMYLSKTSLDYDKIQSTIVFLPKS